MSIVDRIYKLIDSKDISVNEFSKKIDVSNGYFAKQRSANANVGSQIIEKIVREYPDVDLNWLITGEGSMLKTDTYNKVSSPPAPSESNSQIELLKEHLKEKDIFYKEIIKEKDAEIKALNREIGKLQEQLAASKKTSIPYNTDRETYQAMVAEPPVEYGKKA